MQQHDWILRDHAKWNQSYRKGQDPYDLSNMWDIKQKATISKQNKQTQIQTTGWYYKRGKWLGVEVKYMVIED